MPEPIKWPDDKIEAEMRRDAETCQGYEFPWEYISDAGCHVLALLERVRLLEAERDRLRAALQAAVDGCPDCRGLGMREYGCLGEMQECRVCRPWRDALQVQDSPMHVLEPGKVGVE